MAVGKNLSIKSDAFGKMKFEFRLLSIIRLYEVSQLERSKVPNLTVVECKIV